MFLKDTRVKKADKIKFVEDYLLEDVQEYLSEYEKLPIDQYVEKVLILSASLLKIDDIKTCKYRIQVVNTVIEHYFEKVGDIPNPNILGALTNVILLDIFKDKGKKKSDPNNNILSTTQFNRRISREISLIEDFIDYRLLRQNSEYGGVNKRSKELIQY